MSKQANNNIKVLLDESKMATSYANGFRHHASQHEVMLDLGVSVSSQTPEGEKQMAFTISNRVVMNYPTAKRLAGMLVQIIQQHEQRFGEIKLEQ